MKSLLSPASLLFALLGMTLAGCAITPLPTEKKNTIKAVRPDVASQTARIEKKPTPKNTLSLVRASSGDNSTAKNTAAALPAPAKKNPAKNPWQVTIVQNTTALENNHEKIILKKAPFSILVTLPMPQPVRFNTSAVKQNLDTTHTGKTLKELCSPVNLTPFCLGRTLSRVDNNQNLSLENLAHHYFFYKKNINLSWVKVNITPQQTTLEWTIKTINNKPVASYKGTEIYLTLWIDSENRLVFDTDEMKQITLSFSP